MISLEPDEYATIGIVEAHELNEMDLPSSNLIDWDSCLDLRITIGCKNCVDSLSPVFLEKEVSGYGFRVFQNISIFVVCLCSIFHNFIYANLFVFYPIFKIYISKYISKYNK